MTIITIIIQFVEHLVHIISHLKHRGLFAVNKVSHFRAVHLVKPVKPEDTPAPFM